MDATRDYHKVEFLAKHTEIEEAQHTSPSLRICSKMPDQGGEGP
jgi:hypothetical protein